MAEFSDNHVFIVAEMSANHCGDINLAKKIISAAKEIGADAVKIQTYTADTLTIDVKSEIFAIHGGLWNGKYLYDLYKEAYTPWDWQGELKKYADGIGIELFSTPFDRTAVDFLEKIGVPRYKIASFEAIDYPLVEYIASKGKPVIISVGISSYEEICDIVNICRKVNNNDITLLKCTSEYPANINDMNLLTIKDLSEKFSSYGIKVGFSDHSMDMEGVIAAVALGAKVIEKHFTLDRNLGGADSGFSLNKDEFSAMVQAVRKTERALGTVTYEVNEKGRSGGRSLFVVNDIKKGELFTSDNVRSIRPGNGLHTKYYDSLIGKKKARQDLRKGTPLSWDVIE